MITDCPHYYRVKSERVLTQLQESNMLPCARAHFSVGGDSGEFDDGSV